MPSRRAVVGVLCGVAAAGCLGDDGSTGADDSDPENLPTDTTEPTQRTLEEETMQGRAAPITASRTEWDRWVEYQPDDDAVRYVASKGLSSDVDPDDYEQEPPNRDLEFTTTPWGRWKHIRANDVAGDAAIDAVTEELAIDAVGQPIPVSRDPADRPTIVRLEVVDGDQPTVDGDPIGGEDLAAATPESVAVTYELDEKTFETTRDVTVEYRRIELS